MKKLDQGGTFNVLLIPLVLVTLLFFGAAGFGYWAYIGRQDYKNNVDPKVADAVAIAKKETETAKDNEFIEKEKLPLKEYKGPAAYGSVSIQYSKTWSAFVTELNQGSTPVDGYLHPNYVPGVQSGTAFALRLQVTSQQYALELRQFDGNAKLGKVKINAFQAPKVPGVTGVRVDGEILTGKQGSMLLFPLRDKTLKIWTEANQFMGDFNNNIIPNLTFVP